MTLKGLPLFVTILALMAGTVFTRFLPFLLFPPGKEVPGFIKKLQLLLPGAAIGLLVVYCFKNLNIFESGRGIPELAATSATVLLHLWRKNTLLSIAVGTALYMLLVQLVF